jgi:hypothetical protein
VLLLSVPISDRRMVVIMLFHKLIVSIIKDVPTAAELASHSSPTQYYSIDAIKY